MNIRQQATCHICCIIKIRTGNGCRVQKLQNVFATEMQFLGDPSLKIKSRR